MAMAQPAAEPVQLPAFDDLSGTVLQGHVLRVLRRMASGSVHCVVTSPPYHGLRDYGLPPLAWGGKEDCDHEWAVFADSYWDNRRAAALAAVGDDPMLDGVKDFRGHVKSHKCSKCGAWLGHLGNEPIADCLAWARREPPCAACFTCHIRMVGAEVWRVLREDGVFWLNIGDSYSGSGKGPSGENSAVKGQADRQGFHDIRTPTAWPLRDKGLEGIPWSLAKALQADGWVLRCDVIWHKPSSAPESVGNRPTRNLEYVFMFAKSNKTTFWVHPDRPGSRTPPRPDYRWTDRLTGEVRAEEPAPGWASEKLPEGHPDHPKRRWRRDNLWEGADYYFDQEAVRGVTSPGERKEGVGGNIRAVWSLNRPNHRGAHTATFPEDLPERCIKSSTSQRGCCPSCGAPWARIVRKGEYDEEWRGASGADANGEYKGKDQKDYGKTRAQSASDTKRRILEGMRERITVGWRPTCGCGDHEPVPCLVLDPFAGSGTTLRVARRLGRRSVGVELNPEYAEEARRLCAAQRPLEAVPLEGFKG